jgi:hypothetical protein
METVKENLLAYKLFSGRNKAPCLPPTLKYLVSSVHSMKCVRHHLRHEGVHARREYVCLGQPHRVSAL